MCFVIILPILSILKYYTVNYLALCKKLKKNFFLLLLIFNLKISNDVKVNMLPITDKTMISMHIGPIL